MNFNMKFIFNYYKEQILKFKIISKQNENNLIADEKERSIQKIVLASIMGKKIIIYQFSFLNQIEVIFHF